MPSCDMETRYGLDNIDPQYYEEEENMKVTTKNVSEVEGALKSYREKMIRLHQLIGMLDYLCKSDSFVVTFNGAEFDASLDGDFLEYIKCLIMIDIEGLKRDIEYEDHN